MYDCGGPTLVFVTQTHHPLLEHHTGYIFALYDIHYYKPKELFFQHIAEAQVFALYRKARLELDPDAKPDKVSALDYVLSAEDDSRYGEPPDHGLRGQSPASRKGKRNTEAEFELDAALVEQEEEAMLVEVAEIDFFGEE